MTTTQELYDRLCYLVRDTFSGNGVNVTESLDGTAIWVELREDGITLYSSTMKKMTQEFSQVAVSLNGVLVSD